MKVLFAVNSESISEAIIKKYQSDYREILSYKNVYYFNAIQKEIQKDKSYDRIIISEDLEPFTNNNYESIDKFIFEKLDAISDEAHDSQGKEISIILICSDRHTKSSSFLVKIFGIGVYNALLGNDRSMEEVCRLINKPRTKKEAKMYYKIDTDDVNYRAENENEVSELEIQNIISHFKKLGKNSQKYASSFENIASQYTEEQLKIIINCLPINVKIALEENSEKYQEIMAKSGGLVQGIKSKSANAIQDQKRTGIKIDIIENKLNQNKMTKPIVIPNSVKSTKSNVARKVISVPQQGGEKVANEKIEIPKTVKKSEQVKNKVVKPVHRSEDIHKKPVTKQIKHHVEEQDDELPDLGYENRKINTNKIKTEQPKTENLLKSDSQTKKRGRPRKNPIETEPKPKGKRGRPRKKVIKEEENDLLDDDLELKTSQLNLEDDTENDELNNLLELDDNELLDNINDDGSNEDDEIIIPELDELDDIDESENDEDDEFEDEPFDEFDEYDEYGKYSNKKSDDQKIDELYSEDILSENDEIDNSEDDDEDVDYNEQEDDEDIDYDEQDDDELEDIDDENDDEDILLSDIEEDNDDIDLLSGLDDDDLDIEDNDEEIESDDYDNIQADESYGQGGLESINSSIDYSMSNLNSLMTKDKKIVTFLGSPKNGVSFLVNNLAEIFASVGINTAILDMTKNKNSYYIYTQNEETLRKIAYTSIEKLQTGTAEGIRVKQNLTVYTALPNDGKDYTNAEPILSTLVQNHSLVLVDCDFETSPQYFASCQEIYLVQSMDILTIQPLTAFLRELMTQGVLEPEKIKVVINKELKVRGLTNKAIIGGMSFYNDPAMSFMTELFNKDIVKYCSIPFEEGVYSKYLEAILNCKVSLNGYSKNFMNKLRILGDMVYPLTSRQTYTPNQTQNYSQSNFSNSMNDTLSKMKKKI